MRADNAREEALHRLLLVLRPYLAELVLIGGWVPQLYRTHGGFAEWRSQLSGTAELDILVTESDDRTEHRPLARILQDAGLLPDETTAGAVWEGPLATGERIEFFVPHEGVQRSQGKTRQLKKHAGLAALQLSHLEMLGGYTRVLGVVIPRMKGETVIVPVRVPTLGAYVATKASTFMQRGSAARTDDRAKRSKDIVYIRDVMAAGPEVVAQVERDIQAISESKRFRRELRHAANQMTLLNGTSTPLDEAAGELAERDDMAFESARLQLLGYAVDLREILEAGAAED